MAAMGDVAGWYSHAAILQHNWRQGIVKVQICYFGGQYSLLRKSAVCPWWYMISAQAHWCEIVGNVN